MLESQYLSDAHERPSTNPAPSESAEKADRDAATAEGPTDEEARHSAALEESRRKIAELEADKPLWEQSARRRAAQEAKERQAAAAKAKQSQQDVATQRERERQAAKEREEAEERRREADAAEAQRRKRREAQQEAAREAVRCRRMIWRPEQALEHFLRLCEAFDKMNFFKGDVIIFETIPWPTLDRPGSYAVEDVCWDTVESFFTSVRWLMTHKEYVTLVEKSHKRFHPDRWRSRRVLQCVEDEDEKECLEVAANTVAQALTPLWQQVTGR